MILKQTRIHSEVELAVKTSQFCDGMDKINNSKLGEIERLLKNGTI